MYKINGTYYLMAAEGGTEYGHMITLSRGKTVWGNEDGSFESCPFNPILTNRNKAPFIIQGIGHGDLIQDKNGEWHIMCLGFRQQGKWKAYHNLGREVFMVPVTFMDGWFYGGLDKTAAESYEIKGDFTQREKKSFTFDNTDWNKEWCYLRRPDFENYKLSDTKAVLNGTDETLDDIASPTFIGLRQRDFCGTLTVKVTVHEGEAGVTAYMCENEHYEISIRQTKSGFEVLEKLNIGDIKHIQNTLPVESGSVTLKLYMSNDAYSFAAVTENGETVLGSAQSKYLTSEVSNGFTGVILGLYAVGGNAEFTEFEYKYE